MDHILSDKPLPSVSKTSFGNRAAHVDIAKGISIILVVLAHSELRKEAQQLVDAFGLFRMPLFFFLAGLFLNIQTTPKEFINAKFLALLRPYLFTCVAIIVVSLLLGSEDILWKVKGTLHGGGYALHWPPMWFLPHLFAALIFAHTIGCKLHIDKRSFLFKLVFFNRFSDRR